MKMGIPFPYTCSVLLVVILAIGGEAYFRVGKRSHDFSSGSGRHYATDTRSILLARHGGSRGSIRRAPSLERLKGAMLAKKRRISPIKKLKSLFRKRMRASSVSTIAKSSALLDRVGYEKPSFTPYVVSNEYPREQQIVLVPHKVLLHKALLPYSSVNRIVGHYRDYQSYQMAEQERRRVINNGKAKHGRSMVVPSSFDDVAMLSANHNAMERARYPRKGLLTIGPLGFQEASLLATDQYPESWKRGQMKCKEQSSKEKVLYVKDGYQIDMICGINGFFGERINDEI